MTVFVAQDNEFFEKYGPPSGARPECVSERRIQPPATPKALGTIRRSSEIAGFIFDLDGTLVDSGLDFQAMRREMGLPENTPILEAIPRMDPARADRCKEILARHELEGAERATLIPGALEFIRHLDALKIRRALVTRNSRAMAEHTLRHCGLDFELLITREDGPAKPDPWSIRKICEIWDLEPGRVVMLGDFRFDIEAGNEAGANTVYFTRGRPDKTLPGIEQADHVLESFEAPQGVLQALGFGPDTESAT